MRRGRHDGLISFETFDKIQQRLKGTAKAPARADINEDFPLRGFVICDDCDKPLTACWSKSKTGKRHPYYLCYTKGCPSYRKSFRRDQLEGDFEAVLKSLQPSKGLFDLAKAMFTDAWNQRLEQAKDMATGIKKQLITSEKQIEELLDRIIDAKDPSVIGAYEKRIGDLKREKLVTEEKLANAGQPRATFEESFELA